MIFEKSINSPLDDKIKDLLRNTNFHIVIVGDTHKGKSTFLKKLLSTENLKVSSGFITEKIESSDSVQNGVYINSATDEKRYYTSENLCASLKYDNNRNLYTIDEIFSKTFDTLGVNFLRNTTNGLFVMDEIGFLEKDSPLFLNKINEIFESNSSYIAVLKNKNLNYLENLKNKKGNIVFEVGDEYTYRVKKN